MKSTKWAWCGAAALLVGATFVPTAEAWAAAGTAHGITVTLDFSSNPATSLNPVVGPPLTIPASCPFDYTTIFTVTGNGVYHQTSIPSGGDWGGQTVNGSATLNDGALQYVGQATGWGGGGNNATGQGEEGETFHFHGTSATDGSALDVSIDYHGTLNDAGNLTNFSEDVSCR